MKKNRQNLWPVWTAVLIMCITSSACGEGISSADRVLPAQWLGLSKEIIINSNQLNIIIHHPAVPAFFFRFLDAKSIQERRELMMQARSGREHQELMQAARERLPVEEINFYLDEELIQSWQREEDKPANMIKVSLNIEHAEEGAHTLYAEIKYLLQDKITLTSCKTENIILTIDRTPLPAIPLNTINISNGYIGSEGETIHAYGNRLILTVAADKDVHSLSAKSKPFCRVKSKIEDSYITISITGINTKETTLFFTLMDKAGNKTKTTYKIERVL